MNILYKGQPGETCLGIKGDKGNKVNYLCINIRVVIKCVDELLKCAHIFISGQDINPSTHKN